MPPCVVENSVWTNYGPENPWWAVSRSVVSALAIFRQILLVRNRGLAAAVHQKDMDVRCQRLGV